MIPFKDLNLGFTNAENYRRRGNKELLAKYFVRDEYLDRLLDENVYFIVGEKGTGKTAYSTYLSNFEYKNFLSDSYDVRQTEYQKFLELKRMGHLPLSQYSEVWRTLLLILCASSILSRSLTPDFLKRFTKLKSLKLAMDDFYDNAFSPEIIKVLNFVENSEKSIALIAKYADQQLNMGGAKKVEVRDSNATFQTNLLRIRQSFQEALDSLKLDTNHIIFIDGIDIRPSEISYKDYFECVQGLIEAVWALNSDFLSNIKDSRGRIKVVLLVRPDIFLRAGLHNVNTKIRDNSVYLDWGTTYKDYRNSKLFRVADRILSSQQKEILRPGAAWDYYFPFHAENVRSVDTSIGADVSSFLSFLRFSYYRPRDISAMMGTMKQVLGSNESVPYVTASNFADPSFRDAHANYLLGEIRDQLLFYYSQDEFDLFLQFFSHLKGKKKFSYAQFTSALNSFVAECKISGKSLPQFFESADVFLQFLYEQNVLCYIEQEDGDDNSEKFIRWCFRERTPSNLSPKVRTHVDYEIFYGLTKSLNVGRPVKTNSAPQEVLIGTISNLEKEFGFIRGGPNHADYYFRLDQLTGNYKPKIGQKVSFNPEIKYGKLRAANISRVKI